jgi:hypothetical protein
MPLPKLENESSIDHLLLFLNYLLPIKGFKKLKQIVFDLLLG